MEQFKYLCVWQQCEGSTTTSKVYPVTSRFSLEQRIVAYKESNITATVVLQPARAFDLLVLFSARMSPPK